MCVEEDGRVGCLAGTCSEWKGVEALSFRQAGVLYHQTVESNRSGKTD